MPGKTVISIYDDFASDFLSLGDQAQAEVEQLLRTLQVNPYDPGIQRRSFLHDDKFEFPLDGGYSIFWKIHHYTIMRMEILILAVEKRRNK